MPEDILILWSSQTFEGHRSTVTALHLRLLDEVEVYFLEYLSSQYSLLSLKTTKRSIRLHTQAHVHAHTTPTHAPTHARTQARTHIRC